MSFCWNIPAAIISKGPNLSPLLGLLLRSGDHRWSQRRQRVCAAPRRSELGKLSCRTRWVENRKKIVKMSSIHDKNYSIANEEVSVFFWVFFNMYLWAVLETKNHRKRVARIMGATPGGVVVVVAVAVVLSSSLWSGTWRLAMVSFSCLAQGVGRGGPWVFESSGVTKKCFRFLRFNNFVWHLWHFLPHFQDGEVPSTGTIRTRLPQFGLNRDVVEWGEQQRWWCGDGMEGANKRKAETHGLRAWKAIRPSEQMRW